MDEENKNEENDVLAFILAPEIKPTSNCETGFEGDSCDDHNLADENNNLENLMDFNSAKASRKLNDSLIEESEAK